MKANNYRYTYVNSKCVRSSPERDVLQKAREIGEQRQRRLCDAISSPAGVRKFCNGFFTVCDEPSQYLVCLDNRHRVKRVREVGRGYPFDKEAISYQSLVNMLSFGGTPSFLVCLLSASQCEEVKHSDDVSEDYRMLSNAVKEKGHLIDSLLMDTLVMHKHWIMSAAERGWL